MNILHPNWYDEDEFGKLPRNKISRREEFEGVSSLSGRYFHPYLEQFST